MTDEFRMPARGGVSGSVKIVGGLWQAFAVPAAGHPDSVWVAVVWTHASRVVGGDGLPVPVHRHHVQKALQQFRFPVGSAVWRAEALGEWAFNPIKFVSDAAYRQRVIAAGLVIKSEEPWPIH